MPYKHLQLLFYLGLEQSTKASYNQSFQALKQEVIRISGNVRHNLQFIKGFVVIASNVTDSEIIEVLINMFKQKKICQFLYCKHLKTPLESDIVVTFFAEKDAQKTTKEYEYLLNEKQSRFDHFNEENNARDNFLYAKPERQKTIFKEI